jgi:hypothetical protein
MLIALLSHEDAPFWLISGAFALLDVGVLWWLL